MRRLIIIFLLLILITACRANNIMQANSIIRYPAVAGQFYEEDKDVLKAEINGYLAKATSDKNSDNIKGVIVPHAGYYYSAGTAASVYKLLSGKKYDNVILISNSHSQYFNGIAIDNSDVWRTPLGDIAVNKELGNRIVQFDDTTIKLNKEPHLEDHTLEVQLPFLQTVLEQGFKIVPISFGNADKDKYRSLAEALNKNLGKNDLVVVSTDMSHYPNYQDAKDIDTKTIDRIVAKDIPGLEKHIVEIEGKIPGEQTLLCGPDAVKTLIQLSEDFDWQAKKIKYDNSGDVSGDKERVVGYGAVVFFKNQNLKIKDQNDNLKFKIENILTDEQKITLHKIAKETIESFVKNGIVPEFNITDERLKQKQGAFVTLHQNGKLRGCIGQIVPSSQALWEVVRDMAVEAATEDPRFYPVKKEDLNTLDYEISVLSVPEKIDNWENIEMGKHGVIVRQGNMGGVFLPQVATETGWSREEFLSQLCSQKAGLDTECYKDKNTEIKVFTAEVF